MLILCLHGENYYRKLVLSYAAAFDRRGIEFFCIQATLPMEVPLEKSLRLWPLGPSWIFHFESGLPSLLKSFASCLIHKVCFHAKRLRADHILDLHPGYDRLFVCVGHLGVSLLPDFARREFFDDPELPREFEIGWVGQTSSSLYRRRVEWLLRVGVEVRLASLRRRFLLVFQS